MHSESLAVGFVTIFGCKFFFYIGDSGRGQDGWQPVFLTHCVVDDGAGLNRARPSDHLRHSHAAFPGCTFLAMIWSSTAIRESELFCTIVGRKDNDGIVFNTQFFEMIKETTDHIVEFHHTVSIEADAGYAAVLFLQACPDMHAGEIHPHKERFVGLNSARHKVFGCTTKFRIHTFHAFLG